MALSPIKSLNPGVHAGNHETLPCFFMVKSLNSNKVPVKSPVPSRGSAEAEAFEFSLTSRPLPAPRSSHGSSGCGSGDGAGFHSPSKHMDNLSPYISMGCSLPEISFDAHRKVFFKYPMLIA